MRRSSWVFLHATAIAVALAAGCSDDSVGNNNGSGGNQGDPSDGGSAGSDAQTSDDGAATDGGVTFDSGTVATFSYHPQWDGVTKVDVIGAFGQTDDWDPDAPFLSLTKDGSGNYTGTAPSLAAGQYLFLFHVVGDSAQDDPNFDRYAIDPLDTDVQACPKAAPTGNRTDPSNPCSQLTVGVAPATPIHLRGTLTVDGAPATGWLVTVARQENGLHHFFVNRMTVGADGKYDMIASTGRYKIEVDLPDALSKNDIDRDPLSLNVIKGATSNGMMITADVDMETPDLAYHDYGSFSPSNGNGGTLPTMFTFVKGREAALDVYGGKGDGGVVETGDPWFESDEVKNGKYTFDGNFSKGDTDAAVPGTRYMWGTQEPYDASVPWTLQTLVFPVTWH